MSNKETWKYMEEYAVIFGRAEYRCRSIAASENLLGYYDSAGKYRDMAAEIQGSVTWLNEIFREQITIS